MIKTEIDDAEYEQSIKFISKSQKELYPTTNIAYMILNADNRIAKNKILNWLKTEETNVRQLKK